MTMRECEICGTPHSPNMATVVAGTRFGKGPIKYRSIHSRNSPPRWTRAEAEKDYCNHMKQHTND